jgi:hypothetical protein
VFSLQGTGLSFSNKFKPKNFQFLLPVYIIGMDNDNEKLIPENQEGSETNVEEVVELSGKEEAISKYKEAKQRLLNISEWHAYAGKGTADFQLTDSAGNPVNRPAEQGDHFRINIPGPGSKTGEGFDWVQIESIAEETDEDNDINLIAIKVRPASNPQNSNEDVAHFFHPNASSTFLVQRKALKVSAEVHGRNEKVNKESKNVIDKARNAVIAIGAMLGFSDLQWKALVKGLLE